MAWRMDGSQVPNSMSSRITVAHSQPGRRGPVRKRLFGSLVSFVALLVLIQAKQTSASSRTSSSGREIPRKKRRKRRRTPREEYPDLGSSLSSVSLRSAIFSDDEEQERLFAALARLEDETEEEQKAPRRRTEKKPREVENGSASASSLKAARNETESKLNTIAEPPQRDQSERQGTTSSALDSSAAIAQVESSSVTEGGSLSVKHTPTTIQPHPLTALETIQQSPPQRQDLPLKPTLERPQYTHTGAWTARPPPIHQPQAAQRQPIQQQPIVPRKQGPVSAVFAGASAQPRLTTIPAFPAAATAAANGGVRSVVTKPPKDNVPMEASTTTRWVRNFLASRPKDKLLPVPKDYLSDGFNLVMLAPIVERIGRMESGHVVPPPTSQNNESFPLFKAALRLILQQDDFDEQQQSVSSSPAVQRAAQVLYCLVHARYAVSPRGLDTIRRMIKRSDGSVHPIFGRCPRIQCRGMPLLPYGDSDNFDARDMVTTRCKRYCPCCGQVFYMWESKSDESCWGPSFSHLFLMIYGNTVFPDLHRTTTTAADAAASRTDHEDPAPEPTIFGFKLHPTSQIRYLPV